MRARATTQPGVEVANASRIGDMLIRANLVSLHDVDQAIARQRATGRRLGETLLEMGAISSFDLARVLAERQGLPFVDLESAPPDEAVVDLIPADLARRYSAIALSSDGAQLRVALGNPGDVYALDDLESTTGMSIDVVMVDPAQLLVALARLDGASLPPVSHEPTSTADATSRPEPAPGIATRQAAELVVSELRRMELSHRAAQRAASTTWSVDGDAMPLDRYLRVFVDGPPDGAWGGDAGEVWLDLYLLSFRNLTVFLTDIRVDAGAHAFADPWAPTDEMTRAALRRLSQHERALRRRLAGPATNAPMREITQDRLANMRADMGRVLETFMASLRPEYRDWFVLDGLEPNDNLST